VGTKHWRTAVGIPKIDSVETLPQKTSFNVLFDEIFDVSVDTRTGVNETKDRPPFRLIGAIEGGWFL
jgi:hypothetical protein